MTEPNDQLRAALKCAIEHIEHMAAWIGERREGYSFESLGEDMPGIKAALGSSAQTPAAVIERCDYEIGNDGVMTETPEWVRDNLATTLRLLSCHSIDAPIELVETWTDDQVKQADIWAWSCYLSASDNDDMQVPPRPDFLPEATDRWAGRNPITGEPM